MFSSLFKNFRQNWKSALTVSLVSVPLSLALAIASGATPVQGIITAIWAGFFCAFFGGSHFNIAGPTGALSGILIIYTFAHGANALPFIAILSGFLILLAYLFRFDRYIIFIPRNVIHGFTLGVALIIGFNQIDTALGLSYFPQTEYVYQKLIEVLKHSSEISLDTFYFFLLGVFFIFAWNKKFPKFPGVIVLAFFGIFFSWLLQIGFLGDLGSFHLQTLGERYPELEAQIFQNIFSSFSWGIFLEKNIWIVSLATMVIAILETLLSGQIADHMTHTKFDKKKEVLGLGIANIFSGLFGGIPATAALARTSLNIKSGATHKTSAILQSVFLIVITLVFMRYFEFLPMVTISSILVFIAFSMVEKEHFISLLNREKTSFAFTLLVAFITFFEDPIVGILVGASLSLLIFVNNLTKGQGEFLVGNAGKILGTFFVDEYFLKNIPSDLVAYKITGALTYINMPGHLETLSRVKGKKFVILSLRHALYVDSDGIEYLKDLINILKENNEKIILTGINSYVEERIQYEEFYQKKLVEKKIYHRTTDAIRDLYEKS